MVDDLISIVVPIYNSSKTLEKCINSLINQIYKNIEIILVNDGSTDNSLDICKEYEKNDPRIILINKKNGGVSSARNAGINASNGQYLMFCDSDDWAEIDWCNELISHYEEDNLVMCGHYVDGEQNYLPHEIKAVENQDTYETSDFYKLYLLDFNAPWNKIYSNKLIKDYNVRFDEELTNGEDLIFILDYLDRINGKIKFLNKCVFHYNWPQSYNLSNKVPNNYLYQCERITNRLLKFVYTHDNKGLVDVSTRQYQQFEKIILYIIRSENDFSTKKKQCYRVLNNKSYLTVLKNAIISKNQIYTFLLKMNNFYIIWLLYKIRERN